MRPRSSVFPRIVGNPVSGLRLTPVQPNSDVVVLPIEIAGWPAA